MPLVLTQPLAEMSIGNISWRLVRRADNLTTFMCRLSWNLESSTSWSPLGLSRPVMELLYLYLIFPNGISHESPNFLWQGTTSVIMGWMEGLTWKNNSKWYT
jgi:hypothetical protein